MWLWKIYSHEYLISENKVTLNSLFISHISLIVASYSRHPDWKNKFSLFLAWYNWKEFFHRPFRSFLSAQCVYSINIVSWLLFPLSAKQDSIIGPMDLRACRISVREGILVGFCKTHVFEQVRGQAQCIGKLPRKKLKSLLEEGGEKVLGKNSWIFLISSISLGKDLKK